MAGLPLFYICWQIFPTTSCQEPCMSEAQQSWLFWVSIVIAVGAIVTVVVRIRRVRAKRQILEKELLSINSCAILWLAVVVAHFRALAAIDADSEDQTVPSYRNYTAKLAEQARSLRDHMPDIYDWVNQAPTSSGVPSID